MPPPSSPVTAAPPVRPSASVIPLPWAERRPTDWLAEEVSFLEEEIRALDPADRRRAALLHLEVARLMEMSGAAVARIEARVRTAVETCPDLAVAHRTLRKFARKRKAWDEIVATIDAELRLTADPESRAALHVERGRVSRDALRRADAAGDFTAAMSLAPADPSAAEALRTLHASSGEWADLAAVLERSALACPPDRALDLRREAAVLLDHALDRAEQAVPLWEMVLAASPLDAAAIAAAERAYARAGRWLDLCGVLVRQAEASADPARRFASYLRAGTLAAERLGDADRAVRWLEEAAGARPDDPAPLDAVAETHARAGNWEEHEKALARRAALARSPAERSALAVRRARVLSERLSRRADATALLERASADDPANQPAARLLAMLLAREGRTAERVAVEAMAAERISDRAERAAAFHRVAVCCEGDPAMAAAAAAAWERALEAAPADRAAFDGLRRLHERSGAWKQLAGLLERRLGVVGEAGAAERCALLRRLASVREQRLGDLDGAVATLEKLRAAEPRDAAALADLQRLCAATGRWKEHVAALRAEADLSEDPAARADLLWRVGVAAEERLADEVVAWAAYEGAIAALPSHRPSLEALARLAEKRGRPADHLEFAGRTLDGLPPAEQAERLVAMARTAAERLGDEAGAVERCREALRKAPGHAAALEMLARLHEKRREWKDLAEVADAVAAGERDPPRRAALRTRLGDVLAERLDAPAEAATAYRRALADVPGSPLAIEGLERVQLRTADWVGLRETYRAAADASGDPRTRAANLGKLATVLGWRLGKPKDAITVCGQALAFLPNDRGALRELALLHIREKQWRDAADAIARLAAAEADPAAASACIKEEASIREAQLRKDAGDRLAAALERRPADREAISLCEEAGGDAVSPSALLARRLAVTADSVERAMLRLRLSAGAEEASDVTTWFEMVDIGAREAPTFLPVVRAARRAAEAREDWSRTVELLEAEGAPDVTAATGHRLEALRRAAEISLEKLADPGRARAALARAFDLKPADPPVASALAGRLREAADWPALARLLALHAAAVEPSARPRVLFELAEVQRDRLESPADAGRTLEALLATAPRHPAALFALGEIRAATGSWQAAVDAFRSAEDAIGRGDADWRRARLRRVEILSERLGMYSEAETLVRDALGADERDTEMLARLADVLRRAQDWPAVEVVIGRLADLEPPARAVEHALEMARIARGRGDAAGLVGCFARASRLSIQAPGSFASVRAFALKEMGANDVVTTLKNVLYEVPPSSSRATGPMHLLTAQIMASQGKLVEADNEARTAVDLLPDDAEARLLLAQVSGDADEIRNSLFAALGLDPFRTEIFFGLVRVVEHDQRRADLRLCAAQVLAAMGSGDDAIRTLASRVRVPTGEKRLGRDQTLRWILHSSEPRAALELLAAAGPRLGSLYPQPDFGAAEPIPRGTALGQETAAVASMFGVERYDAFYTPRTAVSATLVVDERPKVYVGPGAPVEQIPLLRFHLGRVFVLLATGGGLAATLPPGEIRRLLDGLAGQHVDGLGDPAAVQQVGKLLGWGARRGLAQQARDYASNGPPDLTAWQAATTLTANRGGLLACGDFATARAAVYTMAGARLPRTGSPDAWDASRAVPSLADLLQYAVSPEYLAARSGI